MSDDYITDYEVEPATFPADLLVAERWFTWKLDQGRKIPRAPWSDEHSEETYASWKNEPIWTDFETVNEWVAKLDGYGHASCIPDYGDNSEPRLIFFDFDDVRDPKTGAIHDHAWEFIQTQGLHAAISTSGTGVHGFGYGRLPEGYKPSFERELPDWEHTENPELEVYAESRFMALTGDHIAGTPVGVPDLGETSEELFLRYGEERSTGVEREPDISREELADIETTAGMDDIYDAIAQTRPRDIRLQSSKTGERADGTVNLDPSWANSESGTRLAQFEDHWLYRKGNHNLDALQVVALEERIIHDESAYPSGADFWNAVDALRDRGAHIPEYESAKPTPPSSVDASGDAETAQATDGGAAAADADNDTNPDTESADTTEVDHTIEESWEDIREMFRKAEDNDDREVPRFEAAMKLYREHDFATLRENDQLYAYDPSRGIYNDNGEGFVREHLTRGLEEQYRSHTKSEVLDHLRGRTVVPQDEMGGDEGLIAAKNCVIDLNETTSKEHGPQYRFLSRLGTAFDPDATAPRFHEFLEEVVPSSTERQKLQEFAGYTLMHWGLPYHKALFLVGPTASGKSTFLDTIRAMLGSETVASLTPQQLTTERFAGAELHGKWANIRNDIPASTVKNTGAFKEIAAGDPMKAERKRKDPFMFEPAAKHLFAANELPSTETDDEAFYRRVLLVAFPETIPERDRDKHLDDKLQDELPGVLNWAIEGLQRLLGNGKFTADRSPGRTQDTWSKWADSVTRFKKAAVEDGEEDIPKSEMFAAYLQYCREEGIPSDTQHKMTRELKAAGLEDGREYIDGSQERCFKGVALTSRGEQLLENAGKDTDDDPEVEDRKPTGIEDWD